MSFSNGNMRFACAVIITFFFHDLFASMHAPLQDCAVKMKLVAPPLYVLTTQTLDKGKGVEVLTVGE